MNTVPCIVLKISYVFNKQDEHNASYFSVCLREAMPIQMQI